MLQECIRKLTILILYLKFLTLIQKNSTQQIKLINYESINLSGTRIPLGFFIHLDVRFRCTTWNNKKTRLFDLKHTSFWSQTHVFYLKE